jgi:hypothetical protein
MSSGGFKVPALPSGAPLKRKLPDDSNGSSTKRSRPTVEDDDTSAAVSASAAPVASSTRTQQQTKRSYNFGPSIPIKSNARGGSSAMTDGKGKAREMETDDDAMDVGADGDETFEADEGDEEGRFFGGGTNQTQEVSTVAWSFAPSCWHVL